MRHAAGAASQAVSVGFGPSLREDEGLPPKARIATLTGMASCLLQLGKRSAALSTCEEAAKLGATNEVLFVKAMLLSQLGSSSHSLCEHLARAPRHRSGDFIKATSGPPSNQPLFRRPA